MLAQTMPLDLAAVNFDSVDEINDFAGQLIKVGNSIGIFSCDTLLQSEEAIALYQLANGWVNAVENRMLTMPPSEALLIINAYEIIHRITGRNTKSIDTNKIVLATFNAMIHGDKQIDEYIMFRAIRKAVRQREKAFLGKPLTWSCICEERWHNEAAEGFDHTKLSDYDIISRVTILLESDLFAYEGNNQQRFKQQLFEQYRHLLPTANLLPTLTLNLNGLQAF